MNLLVSIMFIKLFSAVIARPEGQMKIQEKPSSGAPIQAGGDPPLPQAGGVLDRFPIPLTGPRQAGNLSRGDPTQVGDEVDCGGHRAESCAACPLVYTHPENPHQFRHDNGHIWCSGDCFWKDKIGMCELKKPGDVTTDSTGSPESSGTTTERAEPIQPLQGPSVNIVVEKGNATIVVNNIPSIPFPPPSGADDNLQKN